jgi:hypothetical protein
LGGLYLQVREPEPPLMAVVSPKSAPAPVMEEPRPAPVSRRATVEERPPVRDPRARKAARPDEARASTLDLDLVEADVHYRLHRIGACAGEPILIARRGGMALSVTAVGPPERRSEEIAEALADLSQRGLVQFESTGSSNSELPPEALGDAATAVRPPAAVAHSPLVRRFGSEAEFAHRSANALRLAESIYAQAWALQRHGRLPVPDHAHRSPARWLAEAMHRDHSAQIHKLLEQLEDEVSPLLQARAAGCVAGRGATAFESAMEIAAITHRLFAPATAEDLTAAEADAARLGDALSALRCTVQ